MALTRPRREENRFVTFTGWEGYLKFLDAVGEGATRVTYDRGRLELMSPSKEHEHNKTNLGSLLETLMALVGVDFEPGGSVTFKRQDLDRGLEPDECYWVSNCLHMRGKEQYDPTQDPPPDLVVEIEVSRSAMNRLGIYAAFRVPEVWRYTVRRRLDILVLQPSGEYVRVPSSPTLPWLDPRKLQQFMALSQTLTRPQLMERTQAWALEVTRK